MIPLSVLLVVILVGVLWLTRLEERRNRHRPSLKVEGIWTGAERRSEARLSKDSPVYYAFPDTSHLNSSKSENVSGGGMQLVLPEKLSSGTELELEFNLSEGEKPFRVTAEVVWMSEISAEEGRRLFQTGLRFVRMEAGEVERLRGCLYGKGGIDPRGGL